LLVVLLALPCLPTLRPVFLVMPAPESDDASSTLHKESLRRVRGRTAVVSRKNRVYRLRRRYKEGAARTHPHNTHKEPAFLD
jgi:hypothetical protein